MLKTHNPISSLCTTTMLQVRFQLSPGYLCVCVHGLVCVCVYVYVCVCVCVCVVCVCVCVILTVITCFYYKCFERESK